MRADYALAARVISVKIRSTLGHWRVASRLYLLIIISPLSRRRSPFLFLTRRRNW